MYHTILIFFARDVLQLQNSRDNFVCTAALLRFWYKLVYIGLLSPCVRSPNAPGSKVPASKHIQFLARNGKARQQLHFAEPSLVLILEQRVTCLCENKHLFC